MRTRIGLSIILSLWILQLGCEKRSAFQVADVSIPPSIGIHFPGQQSDLLDIRNHEDVHSMRKHAWAIFAGITQPANPRDPNSPPIWDTWYDHDQTFASAGPGPAQREPRRILRPSLELISSLQGRVKTEKDFNTIKDLINPRTAGIEIRYNSVAYKHVRDQRLYDATALRKQLQDDQGVPPNEREIDGFPSSAVVIKAVWRSVGPVSDEPIAIFDRPSSGGCADNCTHPIMVRLAKPGQSCNLPETAPVLSSCFYSVPDPQSRSNSLILLAIHVATKEIPDWTWSTFWWSPRPGDGDFAKDRFPEDTIQNYWRNYLMDTTLGTQTPWEHSVVHGESDGQDPCQQMIEQPSAAKVVFNPDIEIEESNGSPVMKNAHLSNCMNCHRRATYPALEPDMRGIVRRDYLSPAAPCFGAALKVDYLWSLSPPGKPLADFTNKLYTLFNQP